MAQLSWLCFHLLQANCQIGSTTKGCIDWHDHNNVGVAFFIFLMKTPLPHILFWFIDLGIWFCVIFLTQYKCGNEFGGKRYYGVASDPWRSAVR